MLSSDSTTLEGSTSLKVITAAVDAVTATVGQVLKLSNVDGTVEFADDVGGGGGPVYTFSNGLTETAGAVKLGGTLSDALTVLNGGSNDLHFDTIDTFRFINITNLLLRAANSELQGTSTVRIKTPAVNATTASVGQALRLTNATSGEVEFSTIPTTYVQLTDTPGSLGGFDVVPTVNNASTDLQHLSKNIFYSSTDNYIQISPTDGANSVAFTNLPEDSVVFGGNITQITKGTITVDYDVTGTSNLTIEVKQSISGTKYTMTYPFVEFYLRVNNPADNWITPTSVTYTPGGATYVFSSSNTLGTSETFEYKAKIHGAA